MYNENAKEMDVVLLSGRLKIGVSLPSGTEIAAEKRLFSKEIEDLKWMYYNKR